MYGKKKKIDVESLGRQDDNSPTEHERNRRRFFRLWKSRPTKIRKRQFFVRDRSDREKVTRHTGTGSTKRRDPEQKHSGKSRDRETPRSYLRMWEVWKRPVERRKRRPTPCPFPDRRLDPPRSPVFGRSICEKGGRPVWSGRRRRVLSTPLTPDLPLPGPDLGPGSIGITVTHEEDDNRRWRELSQSSG